MNCLSVRPDKEEKRHMEKRRILFVDDDHNILDGLKRMLRGMRHEWDMELVQDPVEAVALIKNTSFDVVVSDMRMPRMDGACLLSFVKDQCPDAVRIILSGYAEKELIMKSFRAAHQYLVKPTDAETLKDVIGRAIALRDLLTSKCLKHLVSRTDSIPSAPATYARIMALLAQQEVSAQEIGRVIEEDLGMTAKILQLVNSAFFGLPRRFSDIRQAVVYLGVDTVKALALTCGIFSRFDSQGPSGLDVEALFAHSRFTGMLSGKIAEAEQMQKEKVEDAFIAGILHDVGKLIIADNFPGSYRSLLSSATAGDHGTYAEAEIQSLGATHAQVGAYLMGLWGLPGSVVEAIAFHHQPSQCPTSVFDPVGAVHAADIFSHFMREADTPIEDAIRWDMAFVERFACTKRIPVWLDIAGNLQKE